MLETPSFSLPIKRYGSDLTEASLRNLPLPDFDNSVFGIASDDTDYNDIPVSCKIGPHMYISKSTLNSIFELTLCTNFENIVYFDCRLPVEYERSHIISSINLVTVRQMERLYHMFENKNCCFIFYGNIAKVRRWVELFRNYDRSINIQNSIPYIFKNVYICDSSFEDIQRSYPKIITPTCSLDDGKPLDRERVKKESRKFKEEMRKNGKLVLLPPQPTMACRALCKSYSQPEV